LRPSADAAGDAHELRRRFAEDGYLYLPGLLDAGWVGQAAADVRDVLRRLGWLADGPAGERPCAPLPPIYGPRWRELYVAVHHVESMHRLGFDAGLRASLAALMGPDVFVLPRRIVRLIGPAGAGGPGVGATAHRDYEGFRIPDMLISWVPLVECPPASGGLWLRRGSHREGMAPCGRFDPAGPRWQTAAYRPGDVVVMHCYSAHATAPNRGETFRLSIDFRWQRAAHPVPRSMLDSDINVDWSQVCEGWQTRRWVSVPDGLTLTDDGPEWAEVRDCPPSQLFTVAPPGRRWRVPGWSRRG
jgi:hypothetical protein